MTIKDALVLISLSCILGLFVLAFISITLNSRIKKKVLFSQEKFKTSDNIAGKFEIVTEKDIYVQQIEIHIYKSVVHSRRNNNRKGDVFYKQILPYNTVFFKRNPIEYSFNIPSLNDLKQTLVDCDTYPAYKKENIWKEIGEYNYELHIFIVGRYMRGYYQIDIPFDTQDLYKNTF